MFRKLMLVIVLMLSLPTFASATWYVSTSTSGSGTITNGGLGLKAYADATPSVDLTVSPAPGQKISSVRINGVALPAVADPTVANVFTVAKKTTTQTVTAYFTATKYAVTSSVGTGGAILPAFTTAINALEYGKDYTFNVKPNSGYTLSTLKVDGLDVPLAASYTFSAISANHSIAATFAFQPSVSSSLSTEGAPVAGNSISLVGAASTNDTGFASYTLAVVNGAGVAQTVSATSNPLNFIFVPAAPGSYTATFTATTNSGLSKTTTKTITVLSIADASVNECVACHSSRDAQAVSEFTSSLHWTSATGASVPDVTKGATNCTQTCHFKSRTTASGCNTCHSDGLQANGSFQNYSISSMSGLYSFKPTAAATCFVCHSGAKHGATTDNFKKSSHYTGGHAKLYYQMDQKACVSCHSSHKPEAVTFDVCNSCHKPGSPYGIYNADMTGKAPHFGAADDQYGTIASFITTDGATCKDCHGHDNTVNAGWAEGGHGDTLAVPWKSDSGHIWNAQGSDGVNFQASPQKTNCIRCHTARGFKAFVESGFTKIDQIRLADGSVSKASAPLTCDGCHLNPDNRAAAGYAAQGLRLANFTTASHGTKGYKAYWGYSTATIAKKKIVTSIQLGDNKNSNLCMPCHSQRASGQEIKDLFAAPAFKQYSAGSAIYPHAAQPAAIFYGKGGYEFTSADTYQDRARHQRIGNYGTDPAGYNGTGNTQGSCVGCHYTADAKYGIGSHSLEAVKFEQFSSKLGRDTAPQIISNACQKCHPSAFTVADIETKRDEFNAAVKALGALLVKKGITLDGVNPLPERKALDMSVGAKNNAVAEKNMGAWFNWYLFSTADKGAYAHNPSYSRRLIYDSIDYLDDGVMNSSSAGTIINLSAASQGSKLTVAEASAAAAFTNDPGCLGCHFGTGSVLNAEVVPGVEQFPHYNDGTVKTSENLTAAQFVVPGTQCNLCHGYGHGTDSPSYSAAKTAYPNISSVQAKGILANYAESAHGDPMGLAWNHYDFKQADRADCSVCHTTKGFISGLQNANANGGKVVATTVWGTTGDTTKQVLGCNTCHSSTTWASSVRTINGGYVASMGGWNKATVIAYPNVGESNVCIPCHAARENGDSIKATVLVANTGGFKNPHYLAAAATFYGKGGFRYYGATDTPAVNVANANGSFNGNVPAYNTEYGVINDGIIVSTTAVPLGSGLTGRNANWNHGKLGMDNYTTSRVAGKIVGTGNKGQCVACHLGPTNTHTFGAYEVANATMGTATTKGCYGCHNGEDMEEVGTFEELPVYQRLMAFFQWNLQQKGMYYNAAKNPYFFADAGYTTNFMAWGATLDQTQKTMGAAHNFKLLDAEKGAHVHNRSYMRQLVFDSIQYLQFGANTYSNSKFYGTTGSENLEDVLKFSAYSSALVAAPDQIKNADGTVVSIQQLKNYVISSSSRTNPVNLTDGTVPATATYGAIKYFRR